LQPTYTCTPQYIFIDLFQKHAAATGTLDMLCEVRFPNTLVDLPSWVPDWSTDQTVPGICIHNRYVGGNHFPGSPIEQYQEYRASGNTRAEVHFENSTIAIKASRVGEIAYLGQVDGGMTVEDIEVVETLGMPDAAGYSGSASATFNDWCNTMLQCPDWDKIEGRYGAENALEVFCRTLIGDRNGRMTRPGESNGSDEDHIDDEGMTDAQGFSDEEQDGISNYEDEHCGSLPPDVEDHRLFSPMDMLNMAIEDYRSCLQISYGKRFAILESGHIGVVPGHSKVSDAVLVALGCSVPLVVRKDSSGTTLVGESYIHGVMDGEALSGTQETFRLI
jgi:hypothetical protein